MLLSVIAFASGIGMWLGTRWGWWCATFYYVYSIARYGNALLLVDGFAEALEDDSRELESYYFKFGALIVFHFLLLLYFFKPNVVEYFGVSDIHKGKAVGLLVAVTASVFAISTGIT